MNGNQRLRGPSTEEVVWSIGDLSFDPAQFSEQARPTRGRPIHLGSLCGAETGQKWVDEDHPVAQ